MKENQSVKLEGKQLENFLVKSKKSEEELKGKQT